MRVSADQRGECLADRPHYPDTAEAKMLAALAWELAELVARRRGEQRVSFSRFWLVARPASTRDARAAGAVEICVGCGAAIVCSFTMDF